jgi:hypothetical protein
VLVSHQLARAQYTAIGLLFSCWTFAFARELPRHHHSSLPRSICHATKCSSLSTSPPASSGTVRRRGVTDCHALVFVRWSYFTWFMEEGASLPTCTPCRLSIPWQQWQLQCCHVLCICIVYHPDDSQGMPRFNTHIVVSGDAQAPCNVSAALECALLPLAPQPNPFSSHITQLLQL